MKIYECVPSHCFMPSGWELARMTVIVLDYDSFVENTAVTVIKKKKSLNTVLKCICKAITDPIPKRPPESMHPHP